MKINKTAILVSFGAGLEYYDFIIYAFLAQYIGAAFFPMHNKTVSLLVSFGLFTAGYLFRPVGGVIFGTLGDKFGRKNVFLLSMLLMAMSTFVMGIIPAYETIGIYASIIIMFLRIIQGVSFGAELPGATTFITEHSDKDNRGLNCALMIIFVTAGALLGSFVVYLINMILSKNAVQVWGWRIPFMIGSFVAVFAYFIRRKTVESPLFEKNSNRQKNPFLHLMKKHYKKVFAICGLILFPSSLVMFALAMPTYFNKVYAFSEKDIYLAISTGYVWSIITLFIFGYLSDRFNRKKMFLLTGIIFAVLCIFYFKILHFNTFHILIIYILIYQAIISILTVCYYPIIAENFPTEVRYTAVAFCYNAVYAVSSTIPMVVNFLYEKTHSEYSVPLLLIIVAVLSLCCLLFIKDYTGKEMKF